MKSENPYYFLIPEKIIEIMMEIEPRFKNIVGYSTDNLKEIISVISSHVRKNKGNWTPLKMTYLRKLVPQADDYLKVLREHGIVERSGNAKKGASSYKYRFALPYQSKYCIVSLNNPKLKRRIEKWQTTMKKRNSKKYPNQNKFIKQMTIEPEALQFIEQTYTTDMDCLFKTVSTLPEDFDQEKYFNNPSTTILNQYNYSVASVNKIFNGEIYTSVDTTEGRYHSNLTNLPKKLRQFIKINGKQLANADVTNCQPYLSTLILNNPGKVAEFTNYPKFSLLLKNIQVAQTEDVKRYISLVRDGIFYEYLVIEFEKKGYKFKASDFQAKREEIKEKLLIVMFAKNSIKPKYRQIFAELFPEVHRVFTLIRGYENGNKFQNYKRFSILLTRIESHIILDKVLVKINNTNPDAIAVTVHDSVMTEILTDHVEIVKNIMEEEFKKIIGIKPNIKIDK